eukprot:9971192-Ditylum_brightwellii.AAC.2
MHQQEEDKAAREQQLLMACIERSKPTSASPSSPSSGFVTPTKSSVANPANSTGTTVSATSCKGEDEKLMDDNDELEKAISKETVPYLPHLSAHTNSTRSM